MGQQYGQHNKKEIDEIENEILEAGTRLLPQERAFVQYVVAGATLIDGWLQAGYSLESPRDQARRAAHRSMKRRDMSHYRRLLEEYAWRTSAMTKAEILNTLANIARGEVMDVKVVAGIGAVNVPTNITDRLSALDKLAKHEQLYASDGQVVASLQPIFINNVPEED